MKLHQKVEATPEISERDPKPTPGPWEVGYGGGLTGPRCAPSTYWDDAGNVVHIPIRHGDQVIAWVAASVDLRKETRDDGEARLLPDARLLAASWEMLEALKSIQWQGSIDGFPCCPACGRHDVEGHNTVCRIGEAIAKATGSEYGSRDSGELGRPKP